VSPAPRQVADRWPSPRALLGLAPRSDECGADLRGTSCLDAPWGRATNGLALLTFASPSEMLPSTRGPSPSSSLRLRISETLRPLRSGTCDPVRIGTPLLGLSMIAPPSTCTPSVHSRSLPHSAELPARNRPRRALRLTGRGSDLRPGDATFRTRSALVVPPDFGGFLRWERCRFVAPCSRPWGSPRFGTAGSAPHGGVARTSPHARPAGPPREGLTGRHRFPLAFRPSEEVRPARDRRRSARTVPGPFPVAQHPSKLFPRQQPCHVTVTVALSPLDRRSGSPVRHILERMWPRGAPRRDRRPQGLAPLASPLRPSGVAADRAPDAPMGFRTLQGLGLALQ
jgi:hypothetical protein